MVASATLALAGCGREDADGRAAPTDARGAGTESDTDSVEPDVRLLDELLADVDATAALVASLVQREQRLAGRLAPLTELHRTHRAALAEAAPDERPDQADGERLPRGRAAALDAVRLREVALQTRLAEGAVAAESGTFARMLASMSAAVGQQLTTTLPEGGSA